MMVERSASVRECLATVMLSVEENVLVVVVGRAAASRC